MAKEHVIVDRITGAITRVDETPDEASARAAVGVAVSQVGTRRAAAISAVRAEITRIKAIAVASRSSTEKAFLGLAYLLLKEE